jgi:predicted ATPase
MLTFGVFNLGPVRSARVQGRPLTVFVGPNNSGKSVIATAIYAALSAPTGMNELGLPLLSNSTAPIDRAQADAFQDELVDLLASPEPPSSTQLSAGLLNYVAQSLDSGLYHYGRSVIVALERAFGSTSDQLRRVDAEARSSRFVIEDTDLEWRVTVSFGKKSTRVYTDSSEASAVVDRISRASWRRIRSRANSAVPQRRLASAFATEAVRTMLSRLRPTLYLPAARSGLMQSQRAIAGAIVRRASLAGIEDVRVPALSGVVADFLSRLITLQRPNYGGPKFLKEADRLEQEIMHGHLSIEDSAGGFPEIMFTTDSGSFPIHRTSSMISELAPVVLMLRVELDPGDMLIIEEPEAHLHPASQVLFAQSIARLVNQDLQVVLTTHSEFFLQQLNNAIVAAEATPATANRLGLRSERLNASSVSAYLFEPSPKGTTVHRLEVLPTSGILESDFSAVAEALYNQTVALYKASRNG